MYEVDSGVENQDFGNMISCGNSDVMCLSQFHMHTRTHIHTGIVCVNRFLVAVTLLMSLTWLFLSTELYTALVYGGILDFTTVVMEESLSAQFI